MSSTGPAKCLAAILAVTTTLGPMGCADNSVWLDNKNQSPVGRTVAYREPIKSWDGLIESDTDSKPLAKVDEWTDIEPISEKVSDPNGRNSPSDASHHWVQTPFPKTMASPRDARQEPDRFEDVSLDAVIQLAFSNSPVVRSLGYRLLESPESAATVYDVDITSSDPFFGPQAALAEFDSVLSASLTSANNDRVFNNVIVGGNAQELVQDIATGTVSAQRRTMTGATFDISGLNGHDANNRTGNLFPNYWDTQLEAGVRQPLLRGAGRQFNSIAGPNAQPGFNFSNGIVIAQMNTQIESANYEIALQQFTRELHDAYWALHRAYASYDNKRQTRDLAFETWQMMKAKAAQGLEGGQIDKESQARQKYYRYQRAVIASLGGGDGEAGLYESERRLRHLMGLPLCDSLLLRPSDSIPVAPVNYDWQSLVATSMLDRVELRRQNVKIHQQQMKLIASKNFLLPQLDVIGRYRIRGFGDDLAGDGPRFASSYDDFFSLDHQEFEFGVEWGAIVGRRQALAAVRNASLQLSRERAVLVEQQRELTAQLGEAISRANSAYYALQAGQEELAAAESRMRATWVLFNVDKSDLFMLLDARESLLEVSERNVADQVLYTLSLVDIAYQSGRLLRDAGVSVAGCFHDDAR